MGTTKQKIIWDVGFQVHQEDLNKLKASLSELSKMNLTKLKLIDPNATKKDLDAITREIRNVEIAMEKAFNPKLNTFNTNSFMTGLRETGSSLQQVYNSLAKGGAQGVAAFRNISNAVLNTNMQLKQSHTLIDKMATTLSNTVRWTIASSAVRSLTGSIQRAWGFTKELDSSLNDIRIVTGKSADQMAKFAQQANAAAQSLGTTTTDYTQAALIYAQQGLSDEEVAARAKITLKAANVTGQSTDAVSENLTAVWNGYKVSAEEAEVYIDRIAAVAATTASNLEELSIGMSRVASAAATMGVSEQQLTAMLSTMISATREAPQTIGTSLRTVFARISDIKAGLDEQGVTLGRYSQKMSELGFNVLDVNGNLRDMGQVLEEIGGRWNDLTREQQVYLSQTMAGQRQYSRLLALFDNFEKYNESLQTARNAAGTLQKQQDTYMDSTQAHLKELKSAWEELFINLTDTKGINKLIDGLTGVANTFSLIVKSVGGLGPILMQLGSIGLTVFSGNIAKALNTTITNFQQGKLQAEEMKNALKGLESFKGIPGLDELTKKIFDLRSDILSNSQFLTPEQFNIYKQQIAQLTETANKWQIAKEQAEQYKQAIDKLKQSNFNTGNPNNILNIDALTNGDPEQLQKLKNLQDTIAKSYSKIFNITQQIQKSTKEINVGKQGELSTEKQKLQINLKNLTSLRNTLNANSGNQQAYKEILKAVQKTGIQFQKIKNNNPFKADALSTDLQKDLNRYEELTKRLFDDNGNIIKDSLSKKQITQYYSLIQRLSKGFVSSFSVDIETIKRQAEKDIHETAETLERTSKEQLQNIETSTKKIKRVADVNLAANILGTISSIGTGIRQLTNLTQIWADKTIDDTEKVTQTFTNLSMTLPTLVYAFSRLKTVLETIKIEDTSGAFKRFLSIHQKGILTFSIWGTVAISAISGVISYFKKLKEQQEQERQERIKNLEQQQGQLKNHRDLYKSLQELDQKYKEHTITRAELKSSVEDLIEQYGLEGSAADTLRKSYDNLYDSMKKIKQQDLETISFNERELFELRKEDYQKLIEQAVESYAPFSRLPGLADESFVKWGSLISTGEKYGLNLGENAYLGEFAQAFTTIFDPTGFLNRNIQTEDPEKFLSQYEQIEKAKNLAFSQEDYESWKQLNGLLTALAPAYNQIAEALKNTRQLELNKEFNKIFDGRSITNIKEYAKAIEEMGGSQQQQQKYLREYEFSLFNTYNEAYNLIKKNGLQIQNVNDEILDRFPQIEENIGILGKFKITSWERLKQILDYLLNADFSKLDLSKLFSTASAQFNFYSGLEEKINPEDYAKLDSYIQQFYSMATDGMYKLTGNAKEFQEAVDRIKLGGFEDNINQLNQAISKLPEEYKVYQDVSNFTYLSDSQLNDKAERTYDEYMQPYGVSGDKISAEIYAKRMDEAEKLSQQVISSYYDGLIEKASKEIEIVKLLGNEDTNNLLLWESDVEQYFEEIDAAYNKIEDVQEKLKEKQKQYEAAVYSNYFAIFTSFESLGDLNNYFDNLENKVINEDVVQAYEKASIALQSALDLENVDEEHLKNLTEYLQENTEIIDELSDSLIYSDDAAEVVAKSIIKMNQGVETLSDNWETWSDMLQNSSAYSDQYSQAISGTKDALANLLDISEAFITQNFIKQNIEDITAASEGSETAIDSLKDKLNELFLSTNVDDSALIEQFEILQTEIPDIEVGVTLQSNDNFIRQLNQLAAQAGWTSEQINAYLDTLGYDATFLEVQQPKYAEVPTTITQTTETDDGQYTGEARFGPVSFPVHVPNTITTTKTTTEKVQVGSEMVTALATNGKTPEIKTITKKATSNFNNSSSVNAGGNKSSSAKPSKKNTEKGIKDDRDIYHDINIELKQVNRQLTRTQKVQSRLFGKELLNNLNQQSAIIDKQKQKLRDKQQIQKKDLEIQQANLKNLGVTFDQYGNISNYMDILGKKANQVNAAVTAYNNLINVYNTLDKEGQEAMEAQLEKSKDYSSKLQEEYKELQDAIKNWDSLQEQIEDVADQITEAIQKQVEINITKFKLEIELRLDMKQAALDYNEFVRNVINHTNVLKDSDFDTLGKDLGKRLADLDVYLPEKGIGSIQAAWDQALKTQKEIESIQQTGTSKIYGDNLKQAMEDMQTYVTEMQNGLQDVYSIVDEIDQMYLDSIDNVEDFFNKQIEGFEYIGELINHDISLLQLLYGDKNYAAMANYYETLQANNNKQLDSLRQQAEFWKSKLDEELAKSEEDRNLALIEKFKQNYKHTIQEINSTIESSAKTLQDKYVNAIEGIFDKLDKQLTNGKGSDYLSLEWQMIEKKSNQYLDAINTAYGIQKAENAYQKAIDSATGRNQKALKKLRDEEIGHLKDKDKITQYDLDRAEKRLQVEQARIALEDAQASKHTMRLKRDSQGNYSYEYVADEARISDAQQALDAARNDLYNFDKEAYLANLKEAQATYQEYMTKRKEIMEDATLSDEERYQKLTLLDETYQELLNNYLVENLDIRQHLLESAVQANNGIYGQEALNFENMTKQEQDSFMEGLVPAWGSGIQEMLDSMRGGQGKEGFIPAVNEAFKDGEKALDDYKKSVEQMAKAAGIDLGEVKLGADSIADAMQKAILPTDEMITLAEQSISTFAEASASVHGMVEQVGGLADKAADATIKFNEFLTAAKNAALIDYSNLEFVDPYALPPGKTPGDDVKVNGVENSDTNSNLGSGTQQSYKDSGIKRSQDDWNLRDKAVSNTKDEKTQTGSRSWQQMAAQSASIAAGALAEDRWKRIAKFDTGGYTGDWEDLQGRLALLDKKELVLNAKDTENILNAVMVLRSFNNTMNEYFEKSKMIMMNKMSDMTQQFHNAIDQAVKIEASFPNINSKKEIEEAFNDLINLAAQKATNYRNNF